MWNCIPLHGMRGLWILNIMMGLRGILRLEEILKPLCTAVWAIWFMGFRLCIGKQAHISSSPKTELPEAYLLRRWNFSSSREPFFRLVFLCARCLWECCCGCFWCGGWGSKFEAQGREEGGQGMELGGIQIPCFCIFFIELKFPSTWHS